MESIIEKKSGIIKMLFRKPAQQSWERFETLFSVILIILLTALAFLPLSGKLGFYHDDWFTTMSSVSGKSLFVMHTVDRPGMGVWYQAIAEILGESPLFWHLFAMTARLIGGLAFLWLGRLVWPEQKLATTLMAVIYTIYPGFLQQPSANNYQNHLVAYSASILSLALTVKAIRSQHRYKKILLSIIALGLAYGFPRMYEAMIGMEGLRFILIWYVQGKSKTRSFWKKLVNTAFWFSPFLLNAGYFVFWRIFQFESRRVTVDAKVLLNNYLANPLGVILEIITGSIMDMFNTVLAAWIVPLYQLSLDVRLRFLFLGIFLGLVAFVLVILYARRMHPDDNNLSTPVRLWGVDAIVIGGLGVLITLLPVAFSGRQVEFRNYLDRYTIQSIVPTAIFIVGIIWIFIHSNYRGYAVAAIVLLAVSTHTFNAANYAANWEMQRQVWWQLSWRAPQIQPGTALIVQMPDKYRYPEGFEIWAPANRIFFPKTIGPVITAEVLNKDTLPDVLSGANVDRNVRQIPFVIDFSKTLVLTIPSTGSCLHSLDGNNVELSLSDNDFTRMVGPVSHLEQIMVYEESHSPPAEIFGREPIHDWCYYYQKADLSRQRGDWQEVARLGDEVLQNGYTASDPVEWTPFFEGYLHMGRLEDANRVADVIRETPAVVENVCEKYTNSTSTFGYDAWQLLCSDL